ncbi:MAG: hypothetical protein ACYS1C_04350 [Planctomycetota bacterium]
MDYAQRSARYAEIAARSRLARGRRASLGGLLVRPPLAFVKSYFLKLGFLDGVAGLAVAVGTAYHRFIRQLRMWELTREEGAEPARAGRAGPGDAGAL